MCHLMSKTSIRLLLTGWAFLTGGMLAAQAADFYVATNGNNLYNGRAPAWDGANGPKLTVEAAVTQANAVVGYHTVNIGTGTFVMAATATPTRPMLILGAGVEWTILDRPTNVATYLFNITSTNIATNSTAITPMRFKDFTIRNDNGGTDKGELMDWTANGLNYLQFDNVSIVDYRHLHYGFRPHNTLNTGNDYFTWRNFTVTSNATDENIGYRWLLGRQASSTSRIRQTGWVWDGCTITDNKAIWGSFTEARWMGEGWTLMNSTWSRNMGQGCSYALSVDSAQECFLGMNIVSNCTIEDNGANASANPYGCGVWAPRMGTGASLVIKDSTIRDTPAPTNQTYGVYVTLPAGKTNGQFRAVNTQFGGAGTFGIFIIDGGATQTSPIELKNVNFNNCATGLAILGAALAPTNSLWYIDPAQSGATISGGTLVSGGRMTWYGDANLDGKVNLEDTRSVGHPYKNIASGATWAQGDFDYDGDFDADDQAWLPAPTGALLILL